MEKARGQEDLWEMENKLGQTTSRSWGGESIGLGVALVVQHCGD